MTATDDPIERFSLASLDPTDSRIEALRALLPEVFADGLVDFDALKRSLGQLVDPGPERFGLSWPGKAECVRLVQMSSIGALAPMVDESLSWDTTQNVIVEGENLEVLKLLQKAYHGKVKLVYIDPPYNTGGDFIYPDNFREGLADYLRYSGQSDSDGLRMAANAETDGRYHSKWLSMIYPRLMLARNLLADDGMIFVSIGDHELQNLRLIMDEIFGLENYLNTVSVRSKVAAGASGGGEDKRLKKNVEYLVGYARNGQAAPGFASSYVEEPLSDVIAGMEEAGESWKYTSVLLDKGPRQKLATIEDGAGQPIDIYLHTGVKRTTVKKLAADRACSTSDVYKSHLGDIFSDTNAQTSIRARVIDAVGALDDDCMYSVEYTPRSGRDKGDLVTHYYISKTVRRVIWLSDVAHIDSSGAAVKKERTGTLWDDIKFNNLGKEGGTPFPNGKKPLKMIRRIIDLVDDPDALILDFFAGSGTTGHAVMEANLADGGKRRYVLIQLPEPYADGEFSNVADLTRERVRRASDEISAEQGLMGAELDLGYRAFKLVESNFRIWDGVSATNPEASLSLLADGTSESATVQGIVAELLLKAGFPLTVGVVQIDVPGVHLYAVADGQLLVVAEGELTIDIVERMVGMDPALILVLDRCFGDDDELKVNTMQTVRAANQGAGTNITLKVV